MPTNANTFNSRVTSEALEAKFRQVFPSQGGAELVQDLFASGVITPVVDFSSVAEGSSLSQNLQTAWDFSTGHNTVINASTTLISNPGFWLVDLAWTVQDTAGAQAANVTITDGISSKIIWEVNVPASGTAVGPFAVENGSFVAFLRAGDSLVASSNSTLNALDVVYRQIADVYGSLVNPLGFSPQ